MFTEATWELEQLVVCMGKDEAGVLVREWACIGAILAVAWGTVAGVGELTWGGAEAWGRRTPSWSTWVACMGVWCRCGASRCVFKWPGRAGVRAGCRLLELVRFAC